MLNYFIKYNIFCIFTLKNDMVDPPSSVPYVIFSCDDNSATFCMGFCSRSTVLNAVKLAV
jgi:hypothetical protein